MENKQYQDLLFKAQFNRETQERKFEAEMTVIFMKRGGNIYQTLLLHRSIEIKEANRNGEMHNEKQ